MRLFLLYLYIFLLIPMRFLHTADWHLCDKLGNHRRKDDLDARVVEVARLCKEHAVDVLLIAGDLFYEHARTDDVVAALQHIKSTFADFFAQGGIILAITGNHDRDSIIDPVREGMNLASPQTTHGKLQPGRMYLQSGRGVATLTKNNETVQFVLVPYPNAHRYSEPGDVLNSREEQNRLYMGRITDFLRGLIPQSAIDVRHPSVLLAHLSLAGLQMQGRYRPTEANSPILQDMTLLEMFAYVAMGDVHQALTVLGNPRIRYSGSLDRLDFGEKNNDCGVVLVEITNGSVQGEPRFLSIPATPMLEIHIVDAEQELPGLSVQYPERDKAIVKVTVACEGLGQMSREEVQQRLKRIFQRLYSVEFVRSDMPPDEVDGELRPRKSYQETVRDYLLSAAELANDPDRAAVLELAEQYLQEAAQ